MRTTIEYMQLCHIHLYQKIARKKVARVNAALWIGVRLDTIPKLYKSKQDEIPKSLTNHQICKI